MTITTETVIRTVGPEMGAAARTLRDSVQESAVAIASCSHAMTGLAVTSVSIAEAAKSVSKQANEISAAARLTLEEVENAANAANELREDSVHGQKSLAGIAEQMSGAAQKAEQAQVTIRTLNAAIQVIEAAATAIGLIASQTRLLALNASIEAARGRSGQRICGSGFGSAAALEFKQGGGPENRGDSGKCARRGGTLVEIHRGHGRRGEALGGIRTKGGR
jgi:methyl-accepting chemotaxis protein